LVNIRMAAVCKLISGHAGGEQRADCDFQSHCVAATFRSTMPPRPARGLAARPDAAAEWPGAGGGRRRGWCRDQQRRALQSGPPHPPTDKKLVTFDAFTGAHGLPVAVHLPVAGLNNSARLRAPLLLELPITHVPHRRLGSCVGHRFSTGAGGCEFLPRRECQLCHADGLPDGARFSSQAGIAGRSPAVRTIPADPDGRVHTCSETRSKSKWRSSRASSPPLERRLRHVAVDPVAATRALSRLRESASWAPPLSLAMRRMSIATSRSW
jgi:hypothetical protein